MSVPRNRAERRAGGQRGPTAMPGGVPDLGALKDNGAAARIIGELEKEAQEVAEFHAGMRCGGCRERIHTGWKFTRFRVQETPQGPQILKQPTFACTRKECDYALTAAKGAVVMEQVRYAWLDEGPGAAALGRDVAVAEAAGEPASPE